MSKSTSPFARLSRYVRPYSWWVVITVTASLFLAAIDIILGKAIERLADGAISSPVHMIMLVIGMIVVGMPCKYIIRYASARFSVSSLRDVRKDLVQRFCDLPLPSVEQRFTGDLVSRLNNNTTILQNFFIQHFASLFYLPIVFIGALTLLLMTSWKLVLGCMVLVPLGLILATILSKPMQSYSERLQDRMSQLNAVAQDAIGGIPIVKAFNMQAALLTKYTLLMDQVVKQGLQLEKRYAALTPVGIGLIATPIILIIAYGGYLIKQGELGAGGIVLFLYLITFILQPLAMVPTLISQIKAASGAAQHLFEALDWSTERQDGAGRPDNMDATPVQFEQVSFSYDGLTNVLDQVSFQVNQGETVAIVGASGSGKSTIFNLLCGFYELEPEKGSVLLFDQLLPVWNLAALRADISMVSQEPSLFPATIAENIGYGHPDAERETIIEAAKAAQAHEFIMQLPEGYDTYLGERGNGLSGGQKQRISIARAFVKDAPLLLLDEPTSALDNQSESLVQGAVKRIMRDRTVIVIAHRLSTIREADRIIVLDQGRVAETGTHDELIQQGGVYNKLYLQGFASSSEDDPAEDGNLLPEKRSENRDLQAGVL